MIGLYLRFALLAIFVEATTQTVYRVYDDTDRSYQLASTICNAFGGKVAMPKTQTEQDAIMEAIVASGHDTNYWIGLKREGQQFVWADDEVLGEWSFWKDDEPSDDAQNDCVKLEASTNKWTTERCNQVNDYICQFDSPVFPDTYDIDVYVVADRQALETYRNNILRTNEMSLGAARYPMADYLTNHMEGIKGSFEAIGINLNIIGVKVLLDDIMTSRNEDTALQQFRDWLERENLFERVHYDLAVLFTGQDISGSTVGLAGQGTVCNSHLGSGFVTFNWARFESLTIHEMGHMLGAFHSTGVMTDLVGADQSFPALSKTQIFTALDFVNSGIFGGWLFNCLQHTPEPQGDLNANLSDDEKTPDVLCNNAFDGSHFCRTPSQYENGEAFGDNICSSLKCTIGYPTECEPLQNAAQYTDGMVCAQGKKCQGGLCLDNPDASNANVDNSCIAGDAPYYLTTNSRVEKYTCGEFVQNWGNAVCASGQEMEGSNCCSTCANLEFSQPDQNGCRYTDGHYIYNRYTYTCPMLKGYGWCNNPGFDILCCQACNAS